MANVKRLGVAVLVLVALVVVLAVACQRSGFPGLEAAKPAPGVGVLTLPVGAQTVTVGSLAQSGGLISWTAAYTDGNWCYNDGQVFLLFKNDDALLTKTVTIQTPLTIGGLAVADQTVAIGPETQKIAGPFNTLWFNELVGTDKGKMSWTWDDGVSAFVAAFSWR